MKPALIIFLGLVFCFSCSYNGKRYRGNCLPPISKGGEKACVLVSVTKVESGVKIRNLTNESIIVKIKDYCGAGINTSFRISPETGTFFDTSAIRKRCVLRIRAANAVGCAYTVDVILGEKR